MRRTKTFPSPMCVCVLYLYECVRWWEYICNMLRVFENENSERRVDFEPLEICMYVFYVATSSAWAASAQMCVCVYNKHARGYVENVRSFCGSTTSSYICTNVQQGNQQSSCLPDMVEAPIRILYIYTFMWHSIERECFYSMVVAVAVYSWYIQNNDNDRERSSSSSRQHTHTKRHKIEAVAAVIGFYFSSSSSSST